MSLESKITKILEKHIASDPAVLSALAKSPLDLVTEIVEAVNEYFHAAEEAACYLLELPIFNGEISIRRQITDTCTLIYLLKRE